MHDIKKLSHKKDVSTNSAMKKSCSSSYTIFFRIYKVLSNATKKKKTRGIKVDIKKIIKETKLYKDNTILEDKEKKTI